jgi:hypothetical protein
MRSAMKLGICVLCMLAITAIARPGSVKAAGCQVGVIYPLTGGAAAGKPSERSPGNLEFTEYLDEHGQTAGIRVLAVRRSS